MYLSWKALTQRLGFSKSATLAEVSHRFLNPSDLFCQRHGPCLCKEFCISAVARSHVYVQQLLLFSFVVTSLAALNRPLPLLLLPSQFNCLRSTMHFWKFALKKIE